MLEMMYLKVYLVIFSESERLLLSGKDSIAISFSVWDENDAGGMMFYTFWPS